MKERRACKTHQHSSAHRHPTSMPSVPGRSSARCGGRAVPPGARRARIKASPEFYPWAPQVLLREQGLPFVPRAERHSSRGGDNGNKSSSITSEWINYFQWLLCANPLPPALGTASRLGHRALGGSSAGTAAGMEDRAGQDCQNSTNASPRGLGRLVTLPTPLCCGDFPSLSPSQRLGGPGCARGTPALLCRQPGGHGAMHPAAWSWPRSRAKLAVWQSHCCQPSCDLPKSDL